MKRIPSPFLAICSIVSACLLTLSLHAQVPTEAPAPDAHTWIAEPETPADLPSAEDRYALALQFHYGQLEVAEEMDAEDMEAMLTAGEMPTPVGIDLEKAIYWYTLAAEQGYHPASCNLARMYFEGQGVPKDIRNAMYWLEKSVAQECPSAPAHLAEFYLFGEEMDPTLKKDVDEAIRLFSLAHQRGYAEAVYALAWVYSPEGPAPDASLHATWQASADEATRAFEAEMEAMEVEFPPMPAVEDAQLLKDGPPVN